MRHPWKGMLMGLVTAVAVASSSTAAHADATCGDLNGSGGRSVSDVVLLFRAVLENPDPAGLCGNAATGALQCGDMNADGAIAVADVVILFNAVLGNETLFPLCSGGGPVIACPGGGGDPAGVKTFTAPTTISSTQTWQSACEYRLNGTIFVEPSVVLTIQAGTTIKGIKGAASPSALIFRRDSKINAQGTSGSPIILTSNQSAGGRLPGDWGGLMLNGRSPVNTPGGEALAEGLDGTPFGGNEPNDSSGIVKFVRVEFAGRIVGTDNELNLFTLNSVGAATQIDHVQANIGLDDGIEWFASTVNATFLASTGAADDGLDWQLGTTGATQFALVEQNAMNLDTQGSNGFEGDNNENNNDAPAPGDPGERSNPKFCNVTLIGAKGQPSHPAGTFTGALLRRGTSGQIGNTLITNFNSHGVEMRDPATSLNACNAGPSLTGDLMMKSSLFYNNGAGSPGVVHCNDHSSTSGATSCSGSPCPCSTCTLYNLWADQGGADAINPDLSPPEAQMDPGVPGNVYPNSDPRPSNGGAVATTFNCSTIDAFFTNTTYIGAFQPGGTNWLTSPWISFATN